MPLVEIKGPYVETRLGDPCEKKTGWKAGIWNKTCASLGPSNVHTNVVKIDR
jgi:hypothetical protein